MTDELKHSHAQADFEQEDLGARPIIIFLVWLAVALGLVGLAVKGTYVLMDRYSEAHQPEVSPLKPAAPADTREAGRGDVAKFPQPRLEENERTELKDFRLKEEERLHSYGWTDEKAGTVHIPIERAMELVAQRGLPVREEAAAGQGKKK